MFSGVWFQQENPSCDKLPAFPPYQQQGTAEYRILHYLGGNELCARTVAYTQTCSLHFHKLWLYLIIVCINLSLVSNFQHIKEPLNTLIGTRFQSWWCVSWPIPRLVNDICQKKKKMLFHVNFLTVYAIVLRAIPAAVYPQVSGQMDIVKTKPNLHLPVVTHGCSKLRFGWDWLYDKNDPMYTL
jgi:hypothetical protein